MKVGLRIDVDTYTGARDGVPRLLGILASRKITATFFLSAGPDNMGRHLFRLLKPAFAKKILRSGGARLYGWEILLRGTLWTGPLIVKALAPHAKRLEGDGHEIGLHGYDHHRWQKRSTAFSVSEAREEIRRGYELLSPLLKRPPAAVAAPSWRSTEETLMAEEGFGFRYSSGCRGKSIFVPAAGGKRLSLPQIPTTLPTYDEVIGRNGIGDGNYNEHILGLVGENALNVLTIHAEAEGMKCSGLFEDFLERSRKRGIEFVPLGSLLPGDFFPLPGGTISAGEVPGREGWVAVENISL
ncbi:MAG: polysaccharide deacetylase family protein [Candidatus Aureabacteria bacterium]|nr:polysaccharide deacetylase family protein [Candidatus Auribacterota bacterium]